MRNESKVHYSQVETHGTCPFKYWCRYKSGLSVLPGNSPKNPLTLGTTMHLATETDYETAREWYIDQFNVGSDKMYDELFKIKYWTPRVKEFLSGLDIIHQEFMIETDDYQGTIDIIDENEDGTVNLWDVKYSNLIDEYKTKEQLIVYKKFYELTTGRKVKHLLYLFIPKCHLKQKDTEQLYQFRKRILNDLDSKSLRVIPVEYSDVKFAKFAKKVLRMQQDTEFIKQSSDWCGLCEWKNYCKNGDDSDMLPANVRRKSGEDGTIKGWIMGPPMSGKSWFLNDAADVLFLNSDGNMDEIDAPFVFIKDEIKKDGRKTIRKQAWEIFEENVDEILKGEHDFKTIVVDLLDDVHEFARLMAYDELGIKHESDAGFGKGYDIVKMKFLPAIKKLMTSDYDVWLVSHVVYGKYTNESGSESEITKAVLSDKTANKIAGMCKVILHAKVSNGKYTVLIPEDDKKFGGSRLKFNKNELPSDYATFLIEYKKAVEAVAKEMENRKQKRSGGVNSDKEGSSKKRESKERGQVEEPKQEVPQEKEKVEEPTGTPQETRTDASTANEPTEKPRRRRRS